MARTQAERIEESLRKLGFQARVTGTTTSADVEEAVDLLEWAATRARRRPASPTVDGYPQ